MARIKTPASIRANGFPAIKIPITACIVVAVTVTHAEAAAVAANVTCVRLAADTNCHIRITQLGTAATVNDTYLPKDKPEYFNVKAGDVISVIRDTADGHLFIDAAEVG